MNERVAAVNNTLARYETIKKFSIMEKDFTLEDGEITPTLKIKRKVVSKKYRNILDSFYDE
jgi:long-chain acyl-CoA synthetase